MGGKSFCRVRYFSQRVRRYAMVNPRGSMFSRRGPDAVTEELVTVLSGEGCHEFKPLFTLVYTKLRARKMVSGGEEMLRLRVYEKLQQLVNQGMVSKVITEGIKEYAGLATLAAPRPLLAITKAIAV